LKAKFEDSEMKQNKTCIFNDLV